MATNVVYDFDKQLARGDKGEAFLDAFFSRHYHITRATRAQQREGIDRFFVSKETGSRMSVEYKTDTTAARTHNAFVETVSVDTTGRPGWAYASKAEYLIYYIPGDELIYVMPFAVLRKQLPRWVQEHKPKAIPNRGYKTHGICVPLDEFERYADVVISV